jgi:hypothetical protein
MPKCVAAMTVKSDMQVFLRFLDVIQIFFPSLFVLNTRTNSKLII